MADRRLLVSDLDGTLLGDAAALDRFARWLAGARDGFIVAYATGRHLPSVQAAVRDEGLPAPDVIISAVGTEMHDGAGRDWPGWSDRFDGTHHRRVSAALGGPGLAHPAGAGQPDRPEGELRRHRPDRVRPSDRGASPGGDGHPGHVDLQRATASSISSRRSRARARRPGSSPTPWVSPHGDVLTFGDSGNDLDLLDGGFRGTMVANALPELVALAAPEVYRSPAVVRGWRPRRHPPLVDSPHRGRERSMIERPEIITIADGQRMAPSEDPTRDCHPPNAPSSICSSGSSSAVSPSRGVPLSSRRRRTARI